MLKKKEAIYTKMVEMLKKIKCMEGKEHETK